MSIRSTTGEEKHPDCLSRVNLRRSSACSVLMAEHRVADLPCHHPWLLDDPDMRILCLLAIIICYSASAARFSIATFTADVTVPANHGMMDGLWKSKSLADPLYAKGVVLFGGDQPVAFVSVDWCEIRNDAYDRWREVIAEAAGTTRARVLVSSIHQHDSPIADLTAQQILNNRKLEGSICDLEFHEVAVQRVAKAIHTAIKHRQPITDIGIPKQRSKGSPPIVATICPTGATPTIVAAPAAAMSSPAMPRKEPSILG